MSARYLLLLLFIGLLTGCGVLGGSEPQVRTELITVEVIITATTDPDATEAVRIITATPDRTQINVPDEIIPDDEDASAQGTIIAQGGNLQSLNAGEDDDDEGAARPNLPENCILYTVDSGDTPFGIALEFEVDPFLFLQVNSLTEETAIGLQIGDELIVPLEGCPVEEIVNLPTPTPIPTETPEGFEATEEATVEATEDPDVTRTPSVTPTVTLAPTATDAQVEIVDVLNVGDVTAEGVRIRNLGSTVNVTGWTLTDLDGNEYVFTEQIIFSNQEVTVFTRTGQDTPVARFWGLDEPVWEAGDVVELRDDSDEVQATLRLATPISLD